MLDYGPDTAQRQRAEVVLFEVIVKVMLEHLEDEAEARVALVLEDIVGHILLHRNQTKIPVRSFLIKFCLNNLFFMFGNKYAGFYFKKKVIYIDTILVLHYMLINNFVFVEYVLIIISTIVDKCF